MSIDQSTVPTISRALDDGTMLELLYDPAARTTALAIALPNGSMSVEASFTLPSGERLVPYSPDNTLIESGCVLLPSDIGDVGDVREVVEEVRRLIHQYVDLSPTFEAVAAHYVLLTWVYDAFSDIPFLRARGDYGTGKTRMLLVVGSLCYKPFFASGASTVSPLFHIQDAFQGTLVLDEADFRFTDQTSDLVKVLNNGSARGLPVLRTMSNRHKELNPRAFRVFGPKVIAMRESFADHALESRFITDDTGGRALRADIPIHLPAAFAGEARLLRNRLLAWRFRNRNSIVGDPERVPAGASPRAKQSLLALLSLVEDAELREHICALHLAEEEKAAHERSETLEADVVATVLAAQREGETAQVTVGEIARRYNQRRTDSFEAPVSDRWMGSFIRRRLRLATHKSGGVYVIPATERTRLAALAARYGVMES